MYQQVGKRVIDLIVAVTGLLVVFPVMGILGLALWISLKEFPLFFQPRPGRHGKVFCLVKLKTMRSQRGERSLPDEERVTAFSACLRDRRLDELPQLWNVLKGDMSLIGPRPLLIDYLPLYNADQNKRHDVRPGITGWAQVKGGNTLSWEEKFTRDNWYVANMSLSLDVHILVVTLKMLAGSGRTPGNRGAVARFKGNGTL